MVWYKRLRWRLIASQFFVALVGVAIMLLATRVIILSSAPKVIRPQLQALLTDALLLAETEQNLILAFRNAVLYSVLVAAVGAVVAGIYSSQVLWRTLIAPLRRLAENSRRVAQGRYGERVDVSDATGEAMTQLVLSFNQMAEALAQTEQQRVALLGNIAHELRTPLTGLKGYLEGLLDDLFPANEETFAGMLHEVNRMSRLIADIQNLSRVEAGQISLEIRPFLLQEIVTRVVTQLQPQAQATGVTLRLEVPETAVMVQADADRTAQVLLNLVGNALRYTPQNGEALVTIRQGLSEAVISVADSGVGIPAESLPYLFERFYRVDESRSRASGGSGIGLTIARHLVWAMGGELTAVSEGEGKGSTFAFTLPLAL
jgi:histidine kinase